jgi:calcineurin-like phosphoesterase family protein
MIFFTADLHFGHENVIRYEDRPFSSCQEMDRVLISNWNKKIKPTDLVYILGDLTFIKSEARIAKLIQQLNGRLFLIKGNHDYFAKKAWAQKYFEQIVDYLEIKIDGYLLCMMHYPLASWNKKHYGSVHLHGHIHSNKLPFFIEGRIYNVGVDVNNYYPISWSELKEKLILEGDVNGMRI